MKVNCHKIYTARAIQVVTLNKILSGRDATKNTSIYLGVELATESICRGGGKEMTLNTKMKRVTLNILKQWSFVIKMKTRG